MSIGPALVVKNWSNPNVPGSDGMVNLQVFVDGSNDVLGKGRDGEWGFNVWKTSVHYSEEPKPGTWHWIEQA